MLKHPPGLIGALALLSAVASVGCTGPNEQTPTTITTVQSAIPATTSLPMPATVPDPLDGVFYPFLPRERITQQFEIVADGSVTTVVSLIDLPIDEGAVRSTIEFFYLLTKRADRNTLDIDPYREGNPHRFALRPQDVKRRFIFMLPDGVPLPPWLLKFGSDQPVAATSTVDGGVISSILRPTKQGLGLRSGFPKTQRTEFNLSFVVEACQSIISVTPTDGAEVDAVTRLSAQEVVCNSLGILVAGKQVGVPKSRLQEILDAGSFSFASSPEAHASQLHYFMPFDDQLYIEAPSTPVV